MKSMFFFAHKSNCSNFFVFWSYELIFSGFFRLVLKRSFPGSFGFWSFQTKVPISLFWGKQNINWLIVQCMFCLPQNNDIGTCRSTLFWKLQNTKDPGNPGGNERFRIKLKINARIELCSDLKRSFSVVFCARGCLEGVYHSYSIAVMQYRTSQLALKMLFFAFSIVFLR